MISLPPVFQWMLVVIAAVTDICTRRIPNWLVLAGMIGGIALNGFVLGWSVIGTSLLGGALAFSTTLSFI